jgi:replication factor A1
MDPNQKDNSTPVTNAVKHEGGDGVSPTLSSGAIRRIWDKAPVDGHPILQVIDVRPISSNNNGVNTATQRHLLLLSDGAHFAETMLVTSLNALIADGRVKTNSAVRLAEWKVNTVGSRQILIAVRLEPLGPPLNARLGNPVDVAPLNPAIATTSAATTAPATALSVATSAGRNAAPSTPTGAAPSTPTRAPSTPTSAPSTPGSGSKRRGAPVTAGSGAGRTLAISELNVHLGRWSVVARVSKKGEMRTFSGRSSGKLFSVDLLDSQGGQIRATAFNQQADKFYDVLTEGGVFRVTNGQIKQVDRSKPWNRSLTHPCEISFTADTEVQQVDDDPSIQTARYDFVKVRDLRNYGAEDVVDLLAVVTNVSDLSEFQSRKSGKPMMKRQLVVCDDTNTSVEVTLWGHIAKSNDEQKLAGCPVVALKSLQVSDFGGRSLSMGFEGSLVLNPDLKEAAALKNWWSQTDHATEPDALTIRSSPSNLRITIDEIEKQRLGLGDLPDYAILRVCITQLVFDREKPPWYKACHNLVANPNAAPSNSVTNRGKGRGGGAQGGDRDAAERLCAKKVSEEAGQFTCLECGPVTDYTNRYMLTVQGADATGSVTMTAFDEVARTLLLDRSADELASMLEEGPPRSEDVAHLFAHEALFRYWILKCRVKAEQVRGSAEPRQRILIMHAKPLDYSEERKYIRSILTPPASATSAVISATAAIASAASHASKADDKPTSSTPHIASAPVSANA